MLYAILAYHEAGVIEALPEPERAAIMERLLKVHDRHAASMGPAARLDFVKDAVTLRGPGKGMLVDGPFAETKEHLLGFYIVDCADMDGAAAIARDLREANPTAVYEIRPVPLYLKGTEIDRKVV